MDAGSPVCFPVGGCLVWDFGMMYKIEILKPLIGSVNENCLKSCEKNDNNIALNQCHAMSLGYNIVSLTWTRSLQGHKQNNVTKSIKSLCYVKAKNSLEQNHWWQNEKYEAS